VAHVLFSTGQSPYAPPRSRRYINKGSPVFRPYGTFPLRPNASFSALPLLLARQVGVFSWRIPTSIFLSRVLPPSTFPGRELLPNINSVYAWVVKVLFCARRLGIEKTVSSDFQGPPLPAFCDQTTPLFFAVLPLCSTFGHRGTR